MPPGAIGVTDFPPSNPPPGLLQEDALTMAIAREFQRLASSKYTVVLTKSSANTCPEYRERGKVAIKAKADVFVSIHINRRNPIPFNPFANGTSAIYNSGKPTSKRLADLMAASVSVSLGVNNRGAMVDDALAVLKEKVTPMTAVLVEAARLSGSDEEKLHAAGSATKVAAGIKAALDVYFGN
ncbi:MAG: N-acetylmuramoyl-L-alanine amidase [Burkholderiales bacterium]|nr:N-acetylmuramoyl-L-alanine amidase [Burkholderiales bacterium]